MKIEEERDRVSKLDGRGEKMEGVSFPLLSSRLTELELTREDLWGLQIIQRAKDPTLYCIESNNLDEELNLLGRVAFSSDDRVLVQIFVVVGFWEATRVVVFEVRAKENGRGQPLLPRIFERERMRMRGRADICRGGLAVEHG